MAYEWMVKIMLTKAEYRKYYKRLRRKFSRQKSEKLSLAVAEKLFSLDIFQQGSVLTYVSFGREVITFNIIDRLLTEERPVFIPYCREEENILGWARITNREKDLERGAYGILEPCPGLREKNSSIEEIDLVLVPGIVFSRTGYRLGYGGGYYDRLLSVLDPASFTIGLTYDEFLVDEVPVEEHDRAVDYIVSDKKILRSKGD